MVVNGIQFLCEMNIIVCITIIMNHCQSFIDKANSNKADNVSDKHASVNLNSDTSNSDSNVTNGFYWKKKTSPANVNKMSRKRIQQVWIRK